MKKYLESFDIDRARKTFEVRPIFWARTFCHVKKKKTTDLQFSSQIDKAMKKLH